MHQQPQHEIFFHLSQSQGELWRHVPSVLQPSQCSLFISWSFQAFWPTFSLDPFQHHLTPYIWFVAIYRTLIHLYVRSEKRFLLEPGRNHSSQPYSSSEYGRYPGSCQSLAGTTLLNRTSVQSTVRYPGSCQSLGGTTPVNRTQVQSTVGTLAPARA